MCRVAVVSKSSANVKGDHDSLLFRGYILLPAASGHADDWVRFRGPNGSGVAGDSGS